MGSPHLSTPRSCLDWYAPFPLVRASSLAFLFFDFESPVPYRLGVYKSRPHLPKGPEGVARQAAQKEVADARKKKRTKEIQQKQEKEQEIARHVKAEERRSAVESELQSEDPIDVDDMVFSEEDSREVIVTSVEHRNPTVMSAGDEQEAERRVVVPLPRKRAASADAVDEREGKQTRSQRSSVASLVSSLPAADAAEQAGRFEERASTHASLGPVPARDL